MLHIRQLMFVYVYVYVYLYVYVYADACVYVCASPHVCVVGGGRRGGFRRRG